MKFVSVDEMLKKMTGELNLDIIDNKTVNGVVAFKAIYKGDGDRKIAGIYSPSNYFRLMIERREKDPPRYSIAVPVIGDTVKLIDQLLDEKVIAGWTISVFAKKFRDAFFGKDNHGIFGDMWVNTSDALLDELV